MIRISMRNHYLRDLTQSEDQVGWRGRKSRGSVGSKHVKSMVQIRPSSEIAKPFMKLF